jgi:glycosyltransferase involved in cell wall biosynthesis
MAEKVPMKVLLIYPTAAAIARGGLWTQVQKTSEALRSLGLEVSVASSPEGKPLTSFDLYHVMGANMSTFHIARELHRRGIPMVVAPVFFSRHSPAFLRFALSTQRMMKRFFLGIWTDYGFIAEIARWSRAVLPNTQAEAILLQRGFDVPAEKLHVVPNGVDERFYRARPEEFLNRYGVHDFILNVGYFGAGRKNTLRLIQVLNSFEEPSVIIGGAEDPVYFERCRREAGKNPRLLLLDDVAGNSDVLASAYAACDVFVLPSLFETPGISALEAGLAGAKVVITKYGGTTEYFGEWAHYVDPMSDDSIAAGIRFALTRQKTPELREHIRKNFLWKHVGEKTYEVYKKVLS